MQRGELQRNFKEMALLLRPSNFLFSTRFRDIVWYMKSQIRLFKYLSSTVSLSKYLRQGVPYKVENWHALTQEQFFSKHLLWNICQCAFKCL